MCICRGLRQPMHECIFVDSPRSAVSPHMPCNWQGYLNYALLHDMALLNGPALCCTARRLRIGCSNL